MEHMKITLADFIRYLQTENNTEIPPVIDLSGQDITDEILINLPSPSKLIPCITPILDLSHNQIKNFQSIEKILQCFDLSTLKKVDLASNQLKQTNVEADVKFIKTLVSNKQLKARFILSDNQIKITTASQFQAALTTFDNEKALGFYFGVNHPSNSIENNYEIMEITETEVASQLQAVANIVYPTFRRNLRHDLGYYAGTLWPLALLGLGLYDLIQYYLNPARRYGMAPMDLLSGLYRREWGLLSGPYDGFPNDYVRFWALPGSLMLSPLLVIGLERALQAVQFKQIENIGSILKKVVYSDGLGMIKNGMPYSAYRSALSAASIFLTLNSIQTHTQFNEWFNDIQLIAKHGSPLLALPAITALGNIAKGTYPTSIFSKATAINADEILETSSLLKGQLFANKAVMALKEITEERAGLCREAAYYQYWAANQQTPLARRGLYVMSKAVQGILLLYTTYRYGQILYQRSQQAYDFFAQQNDCENNQHKAWHYWPVTGEYACTIGGNYSFVPPQLANDPQGCLDALLAVPRSLDELLNTLIYLKHFSGYSKLNLSAWSNNLTAWEEATTQQVFHHLLTLSPQWDIVNISAPVLNPLWPSNNNLVMLGREISQVTVSLFDCTGLNFGPEQWCNFLNAWRPQPGLQGLYAGYLNFADAGMDCFAEWASNHTLALNQMSFPGNGLTDDGGQTGLSSNQTNFIDYSFNQLTGRFFTSAANWLSYSTAQTFILSNNDFTGGDYQLLGQAIAHAPNLTSIALDNINMDDEAIMALSRPWKNQVMALRDFSAANNFITGRGIYFFGLSSAGNVERVNWAGNSLTDDDLPQLQAVLELEQVCWIRIDISNNVFTELGVANFWPALSNTAARSIRVAGMNLNAQAFNPLVALLNNGTLVFDEIDVSSNLIPDQLAAELLNAACQQNVERIVIANNGLSAIFNDINDWPLHQYRCRFINLVGNNFVDADILPLIQRLKDLPALVEVNFNDCLTVGDNTARELARTLISPLPNPADLDFYPLPYDEARALNQSKPAIATKAIYLENTGVTAQGVLPLCNLFPHLTGTQISLSSNTVDMNPVENCQTSSATQLQPFWSRFAFWRHKAQRKDLLGFADMTLSEHQLRALNQNNEIILAESHFSAFNPNSFNQNQRSLSANNNADISAGLLLSAVPIVNVLMLLFLLYLMAKAIKPSSTFSFWKKPERTTKHSPDETKALEKKLALN